MENTNMFYGASPLLFERAKKLRDSMTEAEKKLWHCVKDNQLKGYKLNSEGNILSKILSSISIVIKPD